MHITPLAELVARKERLQGLLQDKKIDGVTFSIFLGLGRTHTCLCPPLGNPFFSCARALTGRVEKAICL